MPKYSRKSLHILRHQSRRQASKLNSNFIGYVYITNKNAFIQEMPTYTTNYKKCFLVLRTKEYTSVNSANRCQSRHPGQSTKAKKMSDTEFSVGTKDERMRNWQSKQMMMTSKYVSGYVKCQHWPNYLRGKRQFFQCT